MSNETNDLVCVYSCCFSSVGPLFHWRISVLSGSDGLPLCSASFELLFFISHPCTTHLRLFADSNRTHCRNGERRCFHVKKSLLKWQQI